jgi:hypothetical protein
MEIMNYPGADVVALATTSLITGCAPVFLETG